MDMWKFYKVGHADLHILNPSSDEKLDEIVELLSLAPESRMLDIGCGKGQFLSRVVRRWNCGAIGVDLSPDFAQDARDLVAREDLSARVQIVEQNAAEFEAPAESFDVVCCLGASWIWGGYSATLDALAGWTKSGGIVISGEPFFKQEPDLAYCEAEGFTRETFDTHEGNMRTGVEKGLGFLHAVVSSDDEWDRYQGYQSRAFERFARANRGDPEIPEILRRARIERDSYFKWGRETLGWAIYLFVKDPFVLEAPR